MPAVLATVIMQYPQYRRPVGPQGDFGWEQKISQPSGFDPRTVQPVTSQDVALRTKYPKYVLPSGLRKFRYLKVN
jgi:hypothetical protein